MYTSQQYAYIAYYHSKPKTTWVVDLSLIKRVIHLKVGSNGSRHTGKHG